MNSRGDVVPALVAPEGVTPVELYAPQVRTPEAPVIGPTHVGEWLMVDVRVAKSVAPGSDLYEICQALGERGACGVIESTLVIDLLEASVGARRVLLDNVNWVEAAASARARPR